MCVLCGDPYSLEAVLSPLLASPLCVPAGDRTLQIHSFLDESKRVVEVSVSSYHGAHAFREELVHGFILVYSAKRKASLSALKAFSANIPNLPIQVNPNPNLPMQVNPNPNLPMQVNHHPNLPIQVKVNPNLPMQVNPNPNLAIQVNPHSNLPIQVLAVTESGSASAFFSSELTQQLMTEGNAVADRLQAHYTTTTASPHQKSTTFTPFFKEVWDKKPEIEQAFNMEDPSGLDDSGEGTLERPGQAMRLVGRGGSAFTPVRRSRAALPPRSHSAEGSEIYESVPPGCENFGGSLGDDLDEPLSPSIGGVYVGDDLYPGGRHRAHPHYGYGGGGRGVAGVGGSVGSSSTQHLTPSDDSDIYSHIDNEDEEQQLVKPSQLKKQRRFQQDPDRCSFPSTESLPTNMSSSPRVKSSPTSAAAAAAAVGVDQTYQNTASVRAACAVPRTPKTKRSNSTCSSPPSSSITAHSSSSLYKQNSASSSSPPIHKASSQQIAREHSFDGNLSSRHGASFRRRGSATGSVSASSTAVRAGSRSGGGGSSFAGLLMGGLDLIPSDNPPPVPPPLNLTHAPFSKNRLPPLPATQKEQQQEGKSEGKPVEENGRPLPAPRKQFFKSESVETGIGSGSNNSSSNNSSCCNTTHKEGGGGGGGGGGTPGSTHSGGCDPVSAPDGAPAAAAEGAGGGGGL
ncbi:hypothetical protein FHG87_020426 [Trinorchestia longiramus]|nr:hypothetical protein FHG87_020426 [Trinorchestia longiramus]